MTKMSLADLPEVFLSNTALTKTISRAVKMGKLRKLASRLYTKNMVDPPEIIIKRNLWIIVAAYFPGGLIADRTAIENTPTSDGLIFLISPQKHKIKLPGITLCPRKGYPPLPNDRPFIGGLFLSSQARACLENIKPSRARMTESSRTLSRQELEEKLEGILRGSGMDILNHLRDEASRISQSLGLIKEYKIFDKLIGSLLGTKSSKLESAVGIARLSGLAYDPKRLHLLAQLQAVLATLAPLSRMAPSLSSAGLTNLSFFEAYFSNFIEGTEFEVNEAADIIFKGKIPAGRPEDAHDILGTFKVVSNTSEMSRIPRNFEELLDLLKTRHISIMEGRPEKLPGEFKKEVNRAGNTIFVAPDLVIGTLKQGFDLYQSLDYPFHKAIFMMFLISEVHPFADGNGRVGRIMMNAELVSRSEQRIIIPTVYRDNYLSALRALSHNAISDPLIRVLDFAQRYTLGIHCDSFNAARLDLERTLAFMDSKEAEEKGLRLILP